MGNRRVKITPLLWGTAFTALGVIELFKKYEVIYGIPLWAICFFCIGASNFISSRWVREKLGIHNPAVMKVASAANIAAIVILILSLIVEFALS
jgi:hypothetical protein